MSAAEYLEALERGAVTTHGEELFLRVRAWWAENDARRHSAESAIKKPACQLSTAGTENLKRLLQLLTEPNPHHILMKAEIARQLGEAHEAEELLTQRLPSPHEHLGSQIRQWLEAGDRRIRQFILADASGIISVAA
jgi:hypothetical protein